MVRPTFFEHKGKRLLLLDYSGLSEAEVVAYMQAAKPVIAAEPPNSVRILNIVAIQFSNQIAAALKGFAAHNAPFVRASAIVGATPFQRSAIPLAMASQGRRNVEIFDDEQEAKDWLAAH